MDLVDVLEDKTNEIDKCCMDLIDKLPNLMIPWYIMAAYAYYVQDDPIITDKLFDKIGRRIYEQWDNLTHAHKNYLSQDMVRSGTYLGEYPSRVKGAVELMREIHGK